MLILGEKEVESNTVSVRKQGEGDIGSFTEKSFVELINNQIEATLAQ
jgi:threonyl-tRNA synthetase